MFSWLLQEAEVLKVQLAAMQEAQPMMAAQQTMHSPLRSLYGSPIGSVHTALPTTSIAQVCTPYCPARQQDTCLVLIITYELHGMVVQAQAPAQGSLKVRLKLPVGFQQRASQLSPKPVAAPASGKQVKGTLVQGRAEGTVSLVKLLLALLSA